MKHITFVVPHLHEGEMKIVSPALHTLLPSVFQSMDPIGKKKKIKHNTLLAPLVYECRLKIVPFVVHTLFPAVL